MFSDVNIVFDTILWSMLRPTRNSLLKGSCIVFLVVFYYIFLSIVIIVVVNWVLFYSDIVVLVTRSVVFVTVLVLVAVKFPELFTAEFIVGDVFSGKFTRHGLFLCSVLCYQFSAKYGSFNPLPLLSQARRVYLVKRRGSVFLLVEVHGLTKVFLRRRLRKIDCILSSVLYSCRVSKICLKDFKAYFKEAKLFSGEKIDSRALYLIESLELPDCVIVVSRKRFGLYYFTEGLFKKHILCLKPRYELTEPLLSLLQRKLFEGMYSTQVATTGSTIGYRMIGDYTSGEKVFFNTRGHVLIVGKTGAGKTTLLANLIDCYRRSKYNIIILDSFGELASLGSEVVAGVDFFINPFDFMDPEEVLDIIEKTSVLFLGDRGVFSYMVRDVITRALSKVRGRVTLSRLICELNRIKSSGVGEDVKNGCDAAIRRLRLFYHPVFEKTSHLDLRGVFVINLSGMKPSTRFFFTQILIELLYRTWDPREPLVLAIDELMPVEYVREDRVPSIVEEIAKCARKLNIVFVLGNQEYRTLPLAVRNMPEHLFIFRVIDVKELEYLSKLVSGVTGRNYSDVYRELSMLREGECFYLTKDYAVKMKVKYRPLSRVERCSRVFIDEHKLRESALKYSVKVDRLREVVLMVSRENFIELIKRRDYSRLAEYGLAHRNRCRLTNLGKALAYYYNLLK